MSPTQNTLPDNTRKAAIKLMQARLSNAVDLTTQAKQAHWNAKGPSSIALHELFDQSHKETDGYADLIAERQVALGGQAYGTARYVSEHSGLDEYPLDASAQSEHIAALSVVLAGFDASIRSAIDDSAEIGDQDTSDLFKEISPRCWQIAMAS